MYWFLLFVKMKWHFYWVREYARMLEKTKKRTDLMVDFETYLVLQDMKAFALKRGTYHSLKCEDLMNIVYDTLIDAFKEGA